MTVVKDTSVSTPVYMEDYAFFVGWTDLVFL